MVLRAKILAAPICLLVAGSVTLAGSRRSDGPKPISAELAKTCRAQAIKAHPTQPPGSKAGYEQAQRDYFRDCVAKGGKVEN